MIIKSKDELVELKDVRPGNVFKKVTGFYFVRTAYRKHYAWEEDERIGCVCLLTGDLFFFPQTLEVEPKNEATLVV